VKKIRTGSMAMTSLVMVALILAIPITSMNTEAAVNDEVLMTVSSASVSPGGSATINFGLYGTLTGFTIDIQYDPNNLAVQNYNNSTPLTFYANTAEAGNITVVWFNTQDNTFSGKIFTVIFKVNNNASGDYDIKMSCDDAVWNNGAIDGSLTSVVGTLTVSGGITTEGTILKVSSASGKVGDIVWINVTIEGNPGIAGSVLIVTYDNDVLDVLSAKAGNVTSNGYFFASTEKPGKITMSWLLLDGVYENGSMMDISFKIKNTTEKSTMIYVKDNGTADPNKEYISTTTVNGNITIGESSSNVGTASEWDMLISIIVVLVFVIVTIGIILLRRRGKNRKGRESDDKK
jgi:hypothetical protein